MKHNSLVSEIIVFSLIVIFLIIPPFFAPAVSSSSVLFDWSFPVKQLSLFVFALVLYIIFDKELRPRDFKFPFPSLRAIGGLFFLVLITRFIVTRYTFDEIQQPRPYGKTEWIYCLLTFFFSAAYEEIIYRFYLPGQIMSFFEHKYQNRFFVFLSDLIAALVFAFAHYYLGKISVINAFFAHIILRWCYVDTGFIWNSVLAHFFYNIISLILL